MSTCVLFLLVLLSLLQAAAAQTSSTQTENATPQQTPPPDAQPSPSDGTLRWQSTEPTELVQINNKVFAFRFGQQSNIFIVTNDGVIATDPLNPRAAEALAKAIHTVTDHPVKYVIYSHNHWNRTLGGRPFKRAGAQFISQENCLPFFEAHPHPDLILPDITFAKTYELTLGERTVELHYLGANHGTCMVVMRLPTEQLLFVVDLVVPKQLPYRTMPDVDVRAWVRSLRDLETNLTFDRLLPGEGRYYVAPATAVREQREYLENLMEAVSDMMSHGTREPKALSQAIKLPDYQHWLMYHEWLPLNVERIWALYELGW
jgi:glyoxylase-like metal-dependent hydrolase (beta-lactamase superfamily II)